MKHLIDVVREGKLDAEKTNDEYPFASIWRSSDECAAGNAQREKIIAAGCIVVLLSIFSYSANLHQRLATVAQSLGFKLLLLPCYTTAARVQ